MILFCLNKKFGFSMKVENPDNFALNLENIVLPIDPQNFAYEMQQATDFLNVLNDEKQNIEFEIKFKGKQGFKFLFFHLDTKQCYAK